MSATLSFNPKSIITIPLFYFSPQNKIYTGRPSIFSGVVFAFSPISVTTTTNITGRLTLFQTMGKRPTPGGPLTSVERVITDLPQG